MRGFITRKQAGLVNPESFSSNITPSRGGCAVHWGGPWQNTSRHSLCIPTWRAWQKYHMEKHGWVDIAYTMGFCNHGYVFAGRGLGVRTASQGTNKGNQNYYAFVWLGGSGQIVSPLALEALEWCINEARKNGGAGSEVRPHSYFKSTTCPGDQLRSDIRQYHNAQLQKDPDMALTPEEHEWLEAVHKQLCTGRDAPSPDETSATVRTRVYQTNQAIGDFVANPPKPVVKVDLPTQYTVTPVE